MKNGTIRILITVILLAVVIGPKSWSRPRLQASPESGTVPAHGLEAHRGIPDRPHAAPATIARAAPARRGDAPQRRSTRASALRPSRKEGAECDRRNAGRVPTLARRSR